MHLTIKLKQISKISPIFLQNKSFYNLLSLQQSNRRLRRAIECCPYLGHSLSPQFFGHCRRNENRKMDNEITKTECKLSNSNNIARLIVLRGERLEVLEAVEGL